MQRFAHLHAQLDASAGDEGACTSALRDYFATAPAADAAWALHLLGGGRAPLRLPDALLRRAGCALARIEPWLFEECERAVGDLAECIALLLPPLLTPAEVAGLAQWIEVRMTAWRELEPTAQEQALRDALAGLDGGSRFVLLKLLSGGRLGVRRALLQRALAAVAGVPPTVMAERLELRRGRRLPASSWQALVAPATGDVIGQPYRFRSLRPWAGGVGELGPLEQWQVQWQFEGERVQLVRRRGGVWVWTREGGLVGKLPAAVSSWVKSLPDGTVIDALLQPGAQRLVVLDLLEAAGIDCRGQSTAQRRSKLEALLPASSAAASLVPLLAASDDQALAAWREQARALGHRGLVLKQRADAYDETSAPWWAWATEPHAVAAVLVYAQPGRAPEAEYTFALWNRAPADEAEVLGVIDAIERGAAAKPGALQLSPVAKIALPADAVSAIDAALREATVARFGPVRVLRPARVAEIAFDSAAASRRHKSGVVLRGARFVRWVEGLGVGAVAAVGKVRSLVAGSG